MSSRAIRPIVEQLERRDVPAITFQTNVLTHTLKITGSADWENVHVIQDDNTGFIVVNYYQIAQPGEIVPMNMQQRMFSGTMLSKIVVDLGAGDDVFQYSLAEGTDLTLARQLTVNTGNGNDTVLIDTAVSHLPAIKENKDKGSGDAGTGALDNPDQAIPFAIDGPADTKNDIHNAGISGNHDTIPFAIDGPNDTKNDIHNAGIADVDLHSTIKANLTVTLDTGNGDDSVDIIMGDIDVRRTARLTVSLGKGDDHFSLTDENNLASRASLIVDVNGNQGNDSIDTRFTGVISDNALVDLLLRGGQGNDALNTKFAGRLDGRLNLRQNGEQGDDSLSLTTDTNPASTGLLSFSLLGNGGDDTITYETLSGLDATVISALLDGGAGTNTAWTSQDIPMLNFTDIFHL